MAGVNLCILLGRVGQEPDVRRTDNNKAVVSLTLATTHEYKDRDGNKKSSTEWHNVVAFGATATIISKYVKKGDQVYISGRIRTEKWEKDGEARYATKVYADRVVLLNNKKGDTSQPEDDEDMNIYYNSPSPF